MENLTTNKYLSEWHVQKAVEENWIFEWPIIAGVATRYEVDHATYKELQYLNVLADKKQSYMSAFSGFSGE